MEEFKGKWIIVDTNLLIKISQYINAGLFDEFLNELESHNIKSVVEESTLFEFRRGSRTKEGGLKY
jgi:hypothetical protein